MRFISSNANDVQHGRVHSQERRSCDSSCKFNLIFKSYFNKNGLVILKNFISGQQNFAADH